MKKLLLIIVLLAVVVIVGSWLSQSSPSAPLEADSTENINKELSALDLGDLDSEFQTANSDINSL